MQFRKPFVFALLALSLITGCSGAVKKVDVGRKPAGEKPFEKVTVPEKISEADRQAMEKTLLVIRTANPDRIALRDRLAESYAGSFEAVPQEDYEKRLEIFKAALALHDPVDLAPDRVAVALVPMAGWIADRYEALGNEAVVLAALRFLILAEPSDAAHGERYRDLADWSESVRATIEDDMDRLSSLGRLYMEVVKMIPDREVVDHLAVILVGRHRALLAHLEAMEQQGGGMPPFLLRMLFQEGGMGKDMIHIYFLAGDPLAALDHLEDISHSAAVGEEYVELLEDLEEGRSLTEVYFSIAGLLGRDDPRAALKACLAARQIDGQDPRFPMCMGMAFEKMGRPGSAIEFYVDASKTSGSEEVLSQSMDMLRDALFEIHRLEQEETAREAIAAVDEVVEGAVLSQAAEEGESVRMSAAALMFTCGVVEFDDGGIDEAATHFKRAAEIWPPLLWAVEKSAEIAHLRGEHEKAVGILTGAMGKNSDGEVPDAYWLAKLLERRGDCYKALGEEEKAKRDYRSALARWGEADIPDDQEPVAAIRMGVLQDRLGEREESTLSFRRAIRLDPDRRATYAEILSYLVVRERLGELEEFYGLAFNQDRIEAMWKIYYGLWVDGLSRRMGKGPHGLAHAYLEQSDGDTWQDDLARYYTGRITLKELRGKARNKGQEVEVDFYSGLRLLGEGKTGEARPLLEKVVASDLMGFFEYRMARALLGQGV